MGLPPNSGFPIFLKLFVFLSEILSDICPRPAQPGPKDCLGDLQPSGRLCMRKFFHTMKYKHIIPLSIYFPHFT